MTIFSKRTLEGCLVVDHRASPGIGPRPDGRQAVKAGTLFESATVTCNHCKCVVVLNPDRKRPRGYCPGCDGFTCDGCEKVRVETGECRSFQKFEDAYLNAA